MRGFILCSVIVIVLCSGVRAGRPNTGRRRGRAKNSDSKRGGKNSLVQSLAYTNALLQGFDINDYDMPVFCSDEELTLAIRRCVLIWKRYCKCKHCTVCSEDEWPPAATEKWSSRVATGWEKLGDAWKWAAQCAYNSTKLWRISCNELQGPGMVTDEETGESKEHEYWYLVNLKNITDESKIQELCLQKECPYVLTAQEFAVDKTTEMTTTKKSEKHGINVKELLECKQDELNAMMIKCMLIWQEYCRCAGCRDVPQCEKNDWPPPQTNEWSSRELAGDLNKVENAWKWVGQCAFNATTEWRDWCYSRSPNSNYPDEPEPEYWFLTELNANTHPKMIQGLCETSECHKFKEAVKPTTPKLTSVKTFGIQNQISTRIQSTATKSTTIIIKSTTMTTEELKVTKSHQTSLSVPKWAYIIIVVLGLVVLVMIALLVLFLYYRAKTKQRNKQQSKFERRGTTSTVTTPWQHQTSFTFFGEQPLPGVEDSIYHTIREAQPSPLPVSPTFAFPSFAPQSYSFKESNSESRPNVLYHDTVPRYQTSFTRKSDSSENQPHTYENTPFSPPPVLPYFIPTGTEQTNEYGTLEDAPDIPEMSHGISQRQSQYRINNQQHKGNYDHIELI